MTFETTKADSVALGSPYLANNCASIGEARGGKTQGSARASRAAIGALANCWEPWTLSCCRIGDWGAGNNQWNALWDLGEGAEIGTRGACAPQTKRRARPVQRDGSLFTTTQVVCFCEFWFSSYAISILTPQTRRMNPIWQIN